MPMSCASTRFVAGIGLALAACANSRGYASAGVDNAREQVHAGSPSQLNGPQPTFGDRVCLHVKFADGQPEGELATLSDLGVRWVRDFVLWRKMERVAGIFEFPPEFARRLDFYRDHGIGLIFILSFDNDVAYPPTDADPLRPIDPELFARYAEEVTKRLKASGVRFVLEIWNEPNNYIIRRRVGGAWNGAPPSPWVQQYVRLVAEVTTRIKRLDPMITLLDDADMWLLHYRYLEAGLPKTLDGFAFHPYTRHQPSPSAVSWFAPERAAVSPDTPWIRPFSVVDDDSSFESAVRRLRDAGSQSLAAVPQMWITEWGWKLNDPGPDGPLTEDSVAAFLPRAFVLAANAGVRATCWFSSEDRADGLWGLIANDGQKRRAYYALRSLTRELGEFTFVERTSGAGHRTLGAQSFLFCHGTSGCTLAAWNVNNQRGFLRLSGPLSSSSVADEFGTPVVASRDADGVPLVPVGPAPIYIRALSPVAAASATFPAFVEASFR
jgi:hypothetical protein